MPRWRRVVYVAGSPLIPAVRLVRIWREARGRPGHRAPWSCLHALVAGLAMDGLGQMVGYALGTGRAADRVARYEFHRASRATDEQREPATGMNARRSRRTTPWTIVPSASSAADVRRPPHAPALTRDPRCIAAPTRARCGVLPKRRPRAHHQHYRELIDDRSTRSPVCVHDRTRRSRLQPNAGKHVRQKPLALAFSSATAWWRRRAGGVCTMVGFNTRRHAQAQRARDAIRRGGWRDRRRVSRLTSFHATAPAWHERRATGGAC
jgi:hypothetical protein